MWKYLLEVMSVGGLIALMAFISWTKMALGGTLTIIGAFFPTPVAKNVRPERGTAQIKFWNLLVKMSGGLRFGVVVAGLVVLVGAIVDGHEAHKEETQKRAKADQAEILKRVIGRYVQNQDSALGKILVEADNSQRGKIATRLNISESALQKAIADAMSEQQLSDDLDRK